MIENGNDDDDGQSLKNNDKNLNHKKLSKNYEKIKKSRKST
jgi:hypothetical protein